MTQTLGAILRNESAAQAERQAVSQQKDLAGQLEQAAQNAAKVVSYFEQLKVKIMADIAKDKRPPTVEHGRDHSQDEVTNLLGLQHFFHSATCMDASHPAHEAWLQFKAWAASQELAVNWHAEHGSKSNDAGYPEEHWWVLQIQPA